jgi:predicted MFS family arabinose efflux permease
MPKRRSESKPPAGHKRSIEMKTDWVGVAFGLTLACLIAFQQFKLPPVLPAMLAEYRWDRTLAGGFMAIYALAGLVFSIPIGRILQRRGLRGLLFAGLGLLLLGNLMTLAFPAAGLVVLIARGLEGVAFAVGAIAGPALASRSASPRHLGLVIGLMAAWIPAGQLLAAGLVLVLPGWQALWLTAAGLTLLLGLWGLALGGHAAFAVAGSGNASVRPAPIVIAGRQRWQLFAVAAIFLLWSMQYFAYMTWLPQYLVEVVGLGQAGVAFAYALPVAVLLGFNILTGLLIGAGVSLRALLIGALLSQAAVWWLIPLALGASGQGEAAGLALLILYGIGAGITPTCLFTLPSAILGREGAPTAFGFVMTGRNIGVFLGPILLAEATKHLGGWGAAWPLFGSTTLLAMLTAVALALLLREKTESRGR